MLFAIYALSLLWALAEGHANYTSLGELWPDMVGLTKQVPGAESPYLGGQILWDHCCLLGLNESVEIRNGRLAFRPGQTFLHGNISVFDRPENPCDTTYTGYEASVPQGTVSYSWCARTCPGWQLNQPSDYSAWSRPIIAFIMPAAIFCINIPRKRQITIPRSLFPRFGFPQILTLIYKVPLAGFLVTLDTIIWLIVVTAMAGPMLLSAFHEALLDYRLVRYLVSSRARSELSARQQTHLALIIILGNLDQELAWNHSCQAVANLSEYVPKRNTTVSTQPICRLITSNDPVAELKSGTDIQRMLKSLLASQIGFGPAVGVAVVFFLGSFVYSLVEAQENLGDSYTAHTIAFAMFWMIIPHVAIISNLLLAGNNPTPWEGMVAGSSTAASVECQKIDSSSGTTTVAASSLDPTQGTYTRIFQETFSAKYDSRYQPAWLWSRGPCKAGWIARFMDENPETSALRKEILEVRMKEIAINMAIPAYSLLVVPGVMGAMVSYTTPSIGLSCRSMVPLVYLSSELVLMALWLWSFLAWKQGPIMGEQERFGNSKDSTFKRSATYTAWYTTSAVFGLTAVMACLVGTLSTFIGFFNNCLCQIPLVYWRDRWTSPGAWMFLGASTDEQVYYASHFWLPTGTAAASFLLMTAYCGWWYQRYLRGQLWDVISKSCEAQDSQTKETDSRV